MFFTQTLSLYQISKGETIRPMVPRQKQSTVLIVHDKSHWGWHFEFIGQINFTLNPFKAKVRNEKDQQIR